MAELELLRVDVFTEDLYSGNPLNVVLGADALDEVQMQRLASEAGCPVTSFVMRSRRAEVKCRFFSPGLEEPMSGHAAVGSVWCLSESGALGALAAGRHRLETPIGVLPFSTETSPDGVRKVWVTVKRPMFAGEGDPKEIASTIGIGVDSLFHDEFPISRASAGIPYLLVPVRSIDVMARIQPNREELSELARELDVAGLVVYSWGVMEQGSTVHSRCFVPASPFLEEPASGMAGAALGAYLVQHDFIGREAHDRIVIEQGHWVGRPSKILVRVEKKGTAIRRLDIGGSARLAFRARITEP